MKTKIFGFFASIFTACMLLFVGVKASTPTDEILHYDIVAQVNDDATVTLNYHIDWLVLESDNAGPLDEIKVGIPNNKYESYEALSDTISSMSISTGGETLAVLSLDRKYYEGETVSVDFQIVQNNLYRVNKNEEGYTVYSFTPGWFDDIDVDSMTLSWKSDKVDSWSPDCYVEDGYLVWETTLLHGLKFNAEVTYPNDAYGFDMSKTVDNMDKKSFGDIIIEIIAVIIVIGFFALIIAGPILFFAFIGFLVNAGFKQNYDKKITRTKIVYFPSCPGCGAVRKEGEDKCAYCGRSMIKSEEVIKEEDIPKEESAIRSKTRNGTYRYSSSPDTYIRVNVVRVPVARPTTTYSSSSHRSSCAHSSCAHSSCAHSSCACACACACAGGGRAGCTNKDFYNTKLKMRFIEKRGV